MQAIAFARDMPSVSYPTFHYTLNGHRQVLIGRLGIQTGNLHDKEKLVSNQSCASIDRRPVNEDYDRRNEEENRPN